MAKLIASEDLGVVMVEVSAEVKKILDNPPENKIDREAFLVYFNTLKDAVQVLFDYLPAGERTAVGDLCGTWMDVGILLGRSPKLLVDILKRTKAKIEEQKEDKTMK